MNQPFLNKDQPVFAAFLKLVTGLLIIGLFFSKALQSISIIVLAIGWIFLKPTKNQLSALFKNRLFLTTTIIAFIYLFSAIISSNKSDAFAAVKDKILFLFVPVSFYLLTFSNVEKIAYKFTFGICAMVQAMYATTFYVQNIKQTAIIYSIGNVLPVIKIHHVQIAVLIAITVLLLLSVVFDTIKKQVQYVAVFIAVVLFFFLHLFAVRSGLILVYLFLILYFSLQWIQLKKWNYLFVFCIFLVGCLYTVTQVSATIKQKIGYMKYDYEQYKNKAADAFQYSDSRRLQSIKYGIEIWKENKLLGCGVGDIKDECAVLYKQQNPTIEERFMYLPHNQYVYFLTGFGLVLGAILMLCFIFPVLYFFRNGENLYCVIYAGLVVFALWDSFLGTLFGTCIYLLIIGFGIQKSKQY
ncbi:MAG: O-antigen ligase family protein [Chitinophagales bacterium]